MQRFINFFLNEDAGEKIRGGRTAFLLFQKCIMQLEVR